MFDDFKRTLTMLEKALDRLLRHKFYNERQHPEVATLIKEAIKDTRNWIQRNELLGDVKGMYLGTSNFINELATLISQLWDSINSKPGKREIKKERRFQEQNKIVKSINSMLENIKQKLKDMKDREGPMPDAFEAGVKQSFENSILKTLKKNPKHRFTEGREVVHFSLERLGKLPISYK